LRAHLETQYSRSACIYNETWGIQDNYIWVNDGCRGQFRVTYRPYYNLNSVDKDLITDEMIGEEVEE
jgi:hypothetical protein